MLLLISFQIMKFLKKIELKQKDYAIENTFLLKLYGPFLWMGFNCLKATATSRRQFTFYHSVPRNYWYSFYRPCKDERLSRPWSHPVVLNTYLFLKAIPCVYCTICNCLFTMWFCVKRFYFKRTFFRTWCFTFMCIKKKQTSYWKF